MSAAFTPGPWEARKDYVHVKGKGPVASVPNPWDDEGEREANTRLIAAAPELYEALLNLLGQFDQAHEALGVERSSSATSAIAEARTALAKARGEVA